MFNKKHLVIMGARKQLSADDNMIPMINIIFLLLIFYIVAGHIKTALPTDVNVPEVTDTFIFPERNNQPHTITIASNGDIYWSQDKVSLTEIPQLVTLLDDDAQLLMYADQTLQAGDLDKVLQLLRATKLTSVHIAIQAEIH